MYNTVSSDLTVGCKFEEEKSLETIIYVKNGQCKKICTKTIEFYFGKKDEICNI